jgi:hypothetical protein
MPTTLSHPHRRGCRDHGRRDLFTIFEHDDTHSTESLTAMLDRQFEDLTRACTEQLKALMSTRNTTFTCTSPPTIIEDTNTDANSPDESLACFNACLNARLDQKLEDIANSIIEYLKALIVARTTAVKVVPSDVSANTTTVSLPTALVYLLLMLNQLDTPATYSRPIAKPPHHCHAEWILALDLTKHNPIDRGPQLTIVAN